MVLKSFNGLFCHRSMAEKVLLKTKTPVFSVVDYLKTSIGICVEKNFFKFNPPFLSN